MIMLARTASVEQPCDERFAAFATGPRSGPVAYSIAADRPLGCALTEPSDDLQRPQPYAPATESRSVPRNQRWAGWLSTRRCQIIDSAMRGEGNGSGRIVKGQIATRSTATRRGTTATDLEPISKNINEWSGTFAVTCRTKPRSASASSTKFVSQPPEVLVTWDKAAKLSNDSTGSAATGLSLDKMATYSSLRRPVHLKRSPPSISVVKAKSTSPSSSWSRM